MTNHELEQLEAELAAMWPRALSPALVDRVEATLDDSHERSSSVWPDRFQLSAIGAGAIAACVIVTMLLKPHRESFPSPAPVLANMAPDPPRAGDYSLLLARADVGP